MEKRKKPEQEENLPNWTCGGIEKCGGMRSLEIEKERKLAEKLIREIGKDDQKRLC